MDFRYPRLHGSPAQTAAHRARRRAGTRSRAVELEAARDGTYAVQVKSAAAESGAVLRVSGVGELTCPVPKSDNIRTNFIASQIGELRLKKGDKMSLRLQPVAQGWHPVNLHSVELIPKR